MRIMKKNLISKIIACMLAVGAITNWSYIQNVNAAENENIPSQEMIVVNENIENDNKSITFDLSNFAPQEKSFINEKGEEVTIGIAPLKNRFSYDLSNGRQTWHCYINVGVANYGFYIDFTVNSSTGRATIHKVFDEHKSIAGFDCSSEELYILTADETSYEPARARYTLKGKIGVWPVVTDATFSLKADIKDKALKIEA